MPAQTHDAVHASSPSPSASSTLRNSRSFPAVKKKKHAPRPTRPAGSSSPTRPQNTAILQAHASSAPSSTPAVNLANLHPRFIADNSPTPTAPDVLLPEQVHIQDLAEFDPASFGLGFSPTGALYAPYFDAFPDQIPPPSLPLPVAALLPPPAPTDRVTFSMSEPPTDSGEQDEQRSGQDPAHISFPLTLQNATSASNSPRSASGPLPPQPPAPPPPTFTLPPLPPGLISTDAHGRPYPLLPPSAYDPLPPSRKRTRSPSESSTSEQRGYADLPFPDASPSQLVAESSGRPRRASLPTRSGTRVQLACVACRNRKIKCNGEKPICENCVRRGTICEYDAQPRRRGPDKKPGGRVRKKELAAAQAQAIAEGRPPPLASPDNEPDSPKRRRRADTGPREGMVPGLPLPPYPYGPPHPAYADPRFAGMYGGPPPPPPPPHMEYGYGPPPQYLYPPRDAMGWLPPPFEGEMHRQESARRESGRDPDPVERSGGQAAAEEETRREAAAGQAGVEQSDPAEPARREEREEREVQGADPQTSASGTAGMGAEAGTTAGEDKGKGRETDMPDMTLGLIADPGADADGGTM